MTATTLQLLESVWGSGPHSVCWKLPGSSKLSFRFADTPGDLLDIAGVLTEQGADVWFGVNPLRNQPLSGRGGAEDVAEAHALYADLDWQDEAHKNDGLPTEDDVRARVADLAMPPSFLVESGHGFQAYWKLSEPLAADERQRANLALETMLREAGLEPEAMDPARILRLPGTFNRKLDPKPVRIITADPERTYSPAEFEPWPPAAGLGRKASGQSMPTPAESPPTLVSGPDPRTWYNDNHNIADELRALGWVKVGVAGWKHPESTNASSGQLTGTNAINVFTTSFPGLLRLGKPFKNGGDGRTVTPFDVFCFREHNGHERDATRAAGEMMRGAVHTTPAPSRTLSGDERQADDDPPLFVIQSVPYPYEPKPLDWLARGLLVDPTHGELGGAKKALKSYVMLGICVGIALGKDVFGRWQVPNPRRVLVFSGEGGRRVLESRVHRIAQAYGGDTGDLLDTFRFTTVAAPVTSPRWRSALVEALDSFDPALVWIDPWYSFAGADINASQLTEVGTVLAGLRSLVGDHRSLLINHHLNQTGSGDSLQRLSGAGHAEWVDSWLTTEHHEPPQVEAGRFTLKLGVGSRQWGGGDHLLHYDVGKFDELLGDHEGGISWRVEPLSHDDKREGKRREDEAALAIVTAWKRRKNTEPWTKARWLDKVSGVNNQMKRAVFDDLVEDGRIKQVGEPTYRDGRGAKFALVTGKDGL